MYTKNTDGIIQINVHEKYWSDNTDQCTLKHWSDNTDQCTLKHWSDNTDQCTLKNTDQIIQINVH